MKELLINWIDHLIEIYIDSINLSSPMIIIRLMVIGILVFCICITGKISVDKRRKIKRTVADNEDNLNGVKIIYHFSKSEEYKRKTEVCIPEIEHLGKCLILYAPSGYGKSFLLWKYAKTLVNEKHFFCRRNIIPVFFRIEEFQEDNRRLDEYILKKLRHLSEPQDESLTDSVLKKYKNVFVIMIDGLEKATSDTIQELGSFIARYKKYNIKIILSVKIENINETNQKKSEKAIKEKYGFGHVDVEMINIPPLDYSIVKTNLKKHSLEDAEYLGTIISIPIFFEMFNSIFDDSIRGKEDFHDVLTDEKREGAIINQMLEQFFEAKIEKNPEKRDLVYTVINYILPVAAIYNKQRNTSLEKALVLSVEYFNRVLSQNADITGQYRRYRKIVPNSKTFEDYIGKIAMDDLGLIYQESLGSRKYFWIPKDYYENWFVAKGIRLFYDIHKYDILAKCLKYINDDIGESFLDGNFNNAKLYDLILARLLKINNMFGSRPEYLLFLKNMVYYYDKFGNRQGNNGLTSHAIELYTAYKNTIPLKDYIEGAETIAYAMLHIRLTSTNMRQVSAVLRDLLTLQKKDEAYVLYRSYTLGDLGAYCLFRKNMERNCRECIARDVLKQLKIIDDTTLLLNCCECAKLFHGQGLIIRQDVEKRIKAGRLSLDKINGISSMEELQYRLSRSYTCLGTDYFYEGEYKIAAEKHKKAIEYLNGVTTYKHFQELLECYERYLGTINTWCTHVKEIEKNSLKSEIGELRNSLLSLFQICGDFQEKANYTFKEHIKIISSRYSDIIEKNPEESCGQLDEEVLKKMSQLE